VTHVFIRFYHILSFETYLILLFFDFLAGMSDVTIDVTVTLNSLFVIRYSLFVIRYSLFVIYLHCLMSEICLQHVLDISLDIDERT
jgi:hypothetical protein